MITWPMVADQFLNEKLVVDVTRSGVSLGVKSPSGWMEERPGAVAAVPVGREEIREAVERVMDPGEEGEERRRRAEELGEKAREAIGEGGSSYRNLIAKAESPPATSAHALELPVPHLLAMHPFCCVSPVPVSETLPRAPLQLRFLPRLSCSLPHQPCCFPPVAALCRPFPWKPATTSATKNSPNNSTDGGRVSYDIFDSRFSAKEPMMFP